MTTFKKYLQEKVISHRPDFANKIVRYLMSIIDNYKPEEEYTEDDVFDILEQYNSKHGDEGLYFSDYTGYNHSSYYGIANAFARVEDGYIEVDIHMEEMTNLLTYYANDNNDKQWRAFIRNLKEVILHEVVHFEQSFKRPEGVDYKTQEKLKKRYGDMMYYNKKDEIMAHAGGVVKQLRNNGFKIDKIKELIRNADAHKHLLIRYSDSYESFYDALAQESPKLWKRFLKYIYQYLEEEK